MKLWDVGTEQSEEPGVDPNTGPQQSAPNTGPVDSDNKVREVPSTVFATPLNQSLKVTLTPESMKSPAQDPRSPPSRTGGERARGAGAQ